MPVPPAANTAADSLDAFASEVEPTRAPSGAAPHRPLFVNWHPQADEPPRRSRWAVGIVGAAFVAAVALAGYGLHRADATPALPVTASITIESDPVGAVVLMSGELRGHTPVALTLPPGTYALEVVWGARRQAVTVEARAERASTHYVQFQQDSPGAGVQTDVR